MRRCPHCGKEIPQEANVLESGNLRPEQRRNIGQAIENGVRPWYMLKSGYSKYLDFYLFLDGQALRRIEHLEKPKGLHYKAWLEGDDDPVMIGVSTNLFPRYKQEAANA